ncbi:MAG: maleylacetoacetate isomerase [Geminicoccaceae bacterium]
MAAERENIQPGTEEDPVPTLYDYWSSSSGYRVRIALALKGIAYRRVVIRRLDGNQEPGYFTVNPQGFVPTLAWDGTRLVQSMAIIEYLDERWPDPPLLPAKPEERARVRALAAMVVSDIQPLNNQRVQDALLAGFGLDEAGLRRWYAKWIAEGFTAIERFLRDGVGTGKFCHGDVPTLADVCLVPQVFNARRWSCDLEPYPLIRRIDAACRELGTFRAAAPEHQSDCPD